MKTWYSITTLVAAVAAAAATNAAAGADVEIAIYDHIGEYGVSARQFNADLKKVGPIKNLTLLINSPGGSVMDGLTIYNTIKILRDGGTTVTARVMGIAASAASFIAMSANEIEMPENSMMMVHYASGMAYGNAEEMRYTAGILDKLDAALVGIYTARTGKDEAEVRALLKDETFLTAEDCVAKGFATKTIPNITAKADFDIERLPPHIQALFKSTAALPAPVVPKTPVAAEIQAAADAAGFTAHAAHFAVNYTTLADAQAAMTTATEIKALCAVAKKDDLLAGFISSKTTVADARIKLVDAMAAASGDDVDNSQPNKPLSGSQPTAGTVTTASIWAARNKQLQRKGA